MEAVTLEFNNGEVVICDPGRKLFMDIFTYFHFFKYWTYLYVYINQENSNIKYQSCSVQLNQFLKYFT